jgi:hypothetical protein
MIGSLLVGLQDKTKPPLAEGRLSFSSEKQVGATRATKSIDAHRHHRYYRSRHQPQ